MRARTSAFARTFADVAPGELLLYEDAAGARRGRGQPRRRGGGARRRAPATEVRTRARLSALGRPRLHLRRHDSTNDRARELAAGGRAARDARHRGRADRGPRPPGPQLGRAGRPALLMSLVLRDPDRAAAAARRPRRRRPRGPAPRAIKWPNDVLVDGRKVAGILVEGRPQEGWAVLGIGVNVAVDLAELPAELRDRAGDARPRRPTASRAGRPARRARARLAEPTEAPSPPSATATRCAGGRPLERREGVAAGIDDDGRCSSERRRRRRASTPARSTSATASGWPRAAGGRPRGVRAVYRATPTAPRWGGRRASRARPDAGFRCGRLELERSRPWSPPRCATGGGRAPWWAPSPRGGASAVLARGAAGPDRDGLQRVGRERVAVGRLAALPAALEPARAAARTSRA